MKLSISLAMGAAAAFCLAACVHQYPVTKIGPDAYEVMVPVTPKLGGVQGAQNLALLHANQRCDRLDKGITVTSIEGVNTSPETDRAVVDFTCT